MPDYSPRLKRRIAALLTVAKALATSEREPYRVIVSDNEAYVYSWLEFAPNGSHTIATFHPRLIRQN